MARPKKQTVDYYPHLAKPGKTIFIIESRWGNDGYAFFHKLLETLCSTDGHVIDYGNPAEREFLLAKTHINDDTAVDILNKLAELGKIDKDLWGEMRIWYQNLVDNIKDAYKKRIHDLPQKPSLRHPKLSTSEFPTPETPLQPVSTDGSTESKVKKSKVKDSIYTCVFEKFWSVYPRKKEKASAFKCWNARLKEKELDTQMILAAERYSLECQINDTEERFTKHAATFLGPSKPYKEYLSAGWKPPEPPKGLKQGQQRKAYGEEMPDI